MIKLLKKTTIRHWVVLGISNLLLVAALGLLMRMKTVFPLPSLNQKYLLHAHSHFAFSGWVSHLLMVLIAAAVFGVKNDGILPRKYQYIIAANLFAAYGMLISFFLQGYGLYSICFSSLTIFISYVFAGICWRDMAAQTICGHIGHWLRASLLFLVLSSVGTFFLAYLMTLHNTDTRLQLAAIYFFLHFQYNGWFFFACMGLFQHWRYRKGVFTTYAKMAFWLFAAACVPGYLLSVLWWDLPGWLYAIVVIAAVMQGLGWWIWLRPLAIKVSLYKHHLPAVAKWLLVGIAAAVTIKILLQALSVIPSLSQLVYGFRPIVIGYLHLVLLVIITLFILAYAYMEGYVSVNRVAIISTGIFTVGVVLNELLLTLQGIFGLVGVYVAHIPMALMAVSGVILLGLIGLLAGQRRRL